MVKVLYVLSTLLLLSCAAQHYQPKTDPESYYEITPVESHPTLSQDR